MFYWAKTKQGEIFIDAEIFIKKPLRRFNWSIVCLLTRLEKSTLITKFTREIFFIEEPQKMS